MTYSITWKRPAGLVCAESDLAIRLRCVKNWSSLGCCDREDALNTSRLGFPILIPSGFYERRFHTASTSEYSSVKREFRSGFLSLDAGPRLELMVSPKESPRHDPIAISAGSRPSVEFGEGNG